MATLKTAKTPTVAPLLSETSILGWIRKNLFSSVLNTLLTFVTLYIIYIAVKGLWVWGIADAVWVAENRRNVSQSAPMVPAGQVSLPGVVQWSLSLLIT